MTAVDTKEMLESVFDEEFGFRLTNFSIKPVHVANGLARALTGRTYDTTAVTRLVRRYVRNQKLGVDEERYPNAEVIADYAAAFAGPKGQEPDALRVTRLARSPSTCSPPTAQCSRRSSRSLCPTSASSPATRRTSEWASSSLGY